MGASEGTSAGRLTASPAAVAQHDAADLHARIDPDGVLGRLLREGHRYSFFQAAWLLETLLADAPAPGEAEAASASRVQFRPHSALVFPAADVREVTWSAEDAARITATFMGLYGVDSPLPVYFYDRIANEADEADVLRDFLDIFNHRQYTFFYRAWKKYRPALHFERSHKNAHAHTFLSLAGLGTPGTAAAAPVPPLRLAAFAGRLGSCVRNAEGLQALLDDLLEGISVRVVEHVPRWVAVAERPRLGGKTRRLAGLGTHSVVGRRVFDVSGTFRLVLGPLTLAQYHALLPGGALARLADALVRLYVQDGLDFDVDLLLATAEVPPLTLSDRRARLGRNTWLGRPAGDVVSEVVAYA